jgi:hypothetical protein
MSAGGSLPWNRPGQGSKDWVASKSELELGDLHAPEANPNANKKNDLRTIRISLKSISFREVWIGLGH